jgi:hypothetical protein
MKEELAMSQCEKTENQAEQNKSHAVADIEAHPTPPHCCFLRKDRCNLAHADLQCWVTRREQWSPERIEEVDDSEREANARTKSHENLCGQDALPDFVVVFIPLFLFHRETVQPIHAGYGGLIIHADYTHSIVGMLALSAALGEMFLPRLGKRVALVIALVSASHWVLDLVVHRADILQSCSSLGSVGCATLRQRWPQFLARPSLWAVGSRGPQEVLAALRSSDA